MKWKSRRPRPENTYQLLQRAGRAFAKADAEREDFAHRFRELEERRAAFIAEVRERDDNFRQQRAA